jgi:radical SAM protein with 4Fe4S-binding SPASM domain
MRMSEHLRRVLATAAVHHQPISVSLELTHRCDFACRHCYIPDHGTTDGLASARIRTLLDELAAAGTLFLTLTGGEPLLRRDWREIARAARERAFALRILTNGGRIDDQAADDIAALQAAVEVSVYSMDPLVFAAITRRDGSLWAVRRGVELLRQRGVPVLLKVPVMAANASGVAAVFAYAESIGAECRANPHIVHDKAGGLGPLAQRAGTEALRAFYRARYPGSKPLPVPPPAPPDGPLCAAGTRYCNITATGEVLACNLLPNSGGNISQHPFAQIWERSPFFGDLRALRRADLSPCGKCPRLAYCGRCHASALVENGDLRGSWTWACEQAALLEQIAAEPG